MSGIAYVATRENLQTVIDQIPSPQIRLKSKPLVASLVEKNGSWEFISRWWYPEAVSMSPYPQLPTALNYRRAVELNRYITNNISTRAGTYQSIQFNVSPEIFSKRYMDVGSFGARHVLKETISKIVRLRRDQVFYDGNHRTALLLLYEILAEHKLLLQANPFALYIRLSNRGETNWESVERSMYQYCKSRLKLLSSVPKLAERPALFANAIKSLDVVNSVTNQMAEMWYMGDGKDQCVHRRQVGRYLKRADRGLYQQFYRLCVLGVWDGPIVTVTRRVIKS
jgi:hypothetical protein